MTAEEEESLALGWEALDEGAFADALRVATEMLRADPQCEEAADLETRALAATGALDMALAKLSRWERADADAFWPLLTRAELLLAADPVRAEEALVALKESGKRVKGSPDAEAEVAWLEGVALLELDEETRALARFDAALQFSPEHLDAQLDRGLLRFELGKLGPAKEDLLPLSEEGVAAAWHTLGLIAEREGKAAEAKQALARATRLDPETFPAPTTLSEAEFDAVVKDALARLPQDARGQMENVLVTVAPIPSDEDLDGGALSPTMLGIFKGTPHGLRSVTSGADHATAQIVLFQKNLERATRSRDELVEQIGITVAHEVGHLLGLDEDDLKDRGLD